MTSLIPAARSMLAATPGRWSALATVDAALLARQPAPGEWSAIQCLQHVVDTEQAVFRSRVLAILDGRDFAAFDPEVEGHVDSVERTAAQLAADLDGLRMASLDTLAALGDADLARAGHHAELGVVTLAELLSEWAAHDTMHMVQAERALMQAFIPGSGPWRPYFADHDVEAARS